MRRIKKPLKDFFDSKELTDKELSFIKGCLKAQVKYPQLTQSQWDVIVSIQNKYETPIEC
tara:strand:+ start:1073 stop:1252 length:180 start_codon:yes stop_codon:yes gene_type:complete